MQVLKVCLLAVVTTALLGIWGCDDNPTKSPSHNPDYYLLIDCGYYPDTDSLYFDLIYSTRTDSVVDSFYLGEESSVYALFSHDGNTTYHTNFHDDIVYSLDWRTGETLAVYHQYGGGRLGLSQAEDYLLLSDAFKTVLLQLPGLTPHSIVPPGRAVFIPNRDLFCNYRIGQDSLDYYDYSQAEITHYAIPFRDSTGEKHLIYDLATSISGDTLYIVAGDQYGCYIVTADTDDLSIYNKIGIYSFYYWQGRLVKHPYREIVYFNDPGSVFSFPPVRGTVYALNLKTEELDIIYDVNIYQYAHPWDLSITPDGKYLYIMSSGNVHKYNTYSGEINDLTGDRNISGASISVNRVDMSKE